MKAQLEDLSGAVALLLRAVPHPTQTPSESHSPQPGGQGTPRTAQIYNGLATGPQEAKGTPSPPKLHPAPARVTSPHNAENTAPAPAPTGYLIDLLLLETPDSAEYIASSAHISSEGEHQLRPEPVSQRNNRGSRRSRPVPGHPLPPVPNQLTFPPPPPRRPRRALLPTPPGWGAAFRSRNTSKPTHQANPSQLPPSGRRRNTGGQRSKTYRPAPSKPAQPTEGILIDLNI